MQKPTYYLALPAAGIYETIYAHAADCVIHISLLHSRTVYIQQPAHQEQQMQMLTNNSEDFIDLLRYSNKKAVYGSTIVLYFFCATISFL
jgi:hypothetical protein